jgi:hypothetical protein
MEQYHEQMKAKRDYWQKQLGKILVETSIKDLEKGREQFEETLRRKLSETRVICNTRLSEDEI